jgi:argininosuccinate lyase
MIESWVGASGSLLPPLLKSLGHTYVFVTRKLEHYQSPHSAEAHPAIRHAEEVIVAETNDTERLIGALRPRSFDGAITVCDYYIDTVREVARAFGIPCPFPNDVKSVRHKHRMREALDRAGLPNPKYRLARSWEEAVAAAEGAIGYPLVVKPVDLASSAFVRLVRNREQLEIAYRQLEAFPLNFRDQARDRTVLLEEYMTGEEVSVESVSCNGATTVLGVTDKSVTGSPYFIENGHMFPADLPGELRSETERLVRDALRAVEYDHGIAHTEVKLTPNGPRIVEINPRTAGNYIVELVKRVTDVDLLHAFVDLALGREPALDAKETDIASAAVLFLVPPQGGVIAGMDGAASLDLDPRIARYKLEDCVGKKVSAPIDNACYLGHVVAEDREGRRARAFAEEALGRIALRFAESGGDE